MGNAPSFCRPEAYELFASQLPEIATTPALVRATIALAMHQDHQANVQQVEQAIASYGREVRSRVRSDDPNALLAHLHEVLFEEAGFAGNSEDYYNPLNSYLPAVLETRRGLPITLTLLYKAVAEPLGFVVRGLNAPGHFMALVSAGGQTMIVDPFCGGGILTPSEAAMRVCEVTGMPAVDPSVVLPVANHTQWIARMILNLERTFSRLGQRQHVQAMMELMELLGEQRGEA